MLPNEIYEKRINYFGLQADRLQKTGNRISMARLIVFISGLVLFVALSSFSVTIAFVVLVASLIAFVWLIVYYNITEKKRVYHNDLLTINNSELECCNGSFSDYNEGAQYISRDHPYTYDLDIFGKASLFQYICRTTSKPASDLLAEYLKSPASLCEIKLRQEAVAELKPLIDWRQDLMTVGHDITKTGNDPENLLRWLDSKNIFVNRRRLMFLMGIFSALTVTAVILVITSFPAGILAPPLLMSFLLNFALSKKISNLHLQVSRSSDLLRTYSSIIGLIEKEKFASGKLSKMRAVFTNDITASEQIKKLSSLVNKLDRRLNVLVSLPLNLLFFNDIRYCLALEKWKSDHSLKIPLWFASMAEFEVLSSYANMAYNNPDWAIPQIVPEFFVLKAVNTGHPLIPSKRRINNDLEIMGEGKAILVTGSNMSGKSTFLRTCGINTVLALSGAPVCATSFSVSLVNVHSSMRISDSLEDNISSFYAELKRLHSIINEAEKNSRVLLLLDEILRGTNSNDRFTGSVALIKQLAGYGTMAMVATHDMKLTELSDELPGRIDNYHFDVKVNGEELFFDYKLTPGKCTSLNASILMKKMGIKV